MKFDHNEAKKEIYCRYIHRNGRIIYPKNAQFFHFWVEDSGSASGSNGSDKLNKAKEN